MKLDDFAALALDYVIVGGGTAGLAVAARLSEDSQIQVGVIEAGLSALDKDDDLSWSINVPGRLGESIGSVYDWKFATVAQPGLAGRQVSWPRGKVLGGTSVLNLMVWNRAHREDYDTWVELGNEGWGWDDLLYALFHGGLCCTVYMLTIYYYSPFFRRSETFHPPKAAMQEQGTAGPVQTMHLRQYSAVHRDWHSTLNNLGVPFNADSQLSGSNTGTYNMVLTIEPNRFERSYSAPAYYMPVSSRCNLHLLTEAVVTNVLIEPGSAGDLVATGVQVCQGDQQVSVRAAREVILSAGTVQSPQLLELSGIGSRDVLEAAGIPLKFHNPNVGENLQDHTSMGHIFPFRSFRRQQLCIQHANELQWHSRSTRFFRLSLRAMMSLTIPPCVKKQTTTTEHQELGRGLHSYPAWSLTVRFPRSFRRKNLLICTAGLSQLLRRLVGCMTSFSPASSPLMAICEVRWSMCFI